MMSLTQKRVKFIWSNIYKDNFQKLKEHLTSAPVLVSPSGSRGFAMYYDASKASLGCVLIQHEKVIAYGSRQLKRPE